MAGVHTWKDNFLVWLRDRCWPPFRLFIPSSTLALFTSPDPRVTLDNPVPKDFFHLHILNRYLLKGLVAEAERNRVEEGWTMLND